ncbi:MAG: hypothetical protein JSS43_10300 [Proteobacteria bacterium]|nr:hypothetical protein [Pseudomonadota bacterium]
MSADRVDCLLQHLREILRRLRSAGSTDKSDDRTAVEPDGFRAVVAQTACTLCRGHCCANGGDDAFLDDQVIARVRRTSAARTDEALVALYADRVPAEGYERSCIFHGRTGCTLDRSMRADVCNTYYCRGLGDYLASQAPPEPTIVIAGDGEKTWASPVLRPPRPAAEAG